MSKSSNPAIQFFTTLTKVSFTRKSPKVVKNLGPPMKNIKFRVFSSVNFLKMAKKHFFKLQIGELRGKKCERSPKIGIHSEKNNNFLLKIQTFRLISEKQHISNLESTKKLVSPQQKKEKKLRYNNKC